MKKKTEKKKASRAIGIMLIAMIACFIIAPGITEVAQADHETRNYRVIQLGQNDNFLELNNGLSEVRVRVWLYEGTLWGTRNHRVVFARLERRSPGWQATCYHQETEVFGGSVMTLNSYGVYSPYPLDGGTGYGSWPWNLIGSHMDSGVFVPTNWRTTNWDVYVINSPHWNYAVHIRQGSRTTYYHNAHIGTAFNVGESGADGYYVYSYIRIQKLQWYGWQTKTGSGSVSFSE